MYLGQEKIAKRKSVVSRADGAVPVPTGALNYADVIKQYDAQIAIIKQKIADNASYISAVQGDLATLQRDRGQCDLDAGEVAQVVFLGRFGQFASSNECFDDNTRRQDEARNKIASAIDTENRLKDQMMALQAEKERAISDNRAQIKADTIAQTERMKAEAGKAVALGQVDPEVIKARAELEAESGLTGNKKILYAGVVIFIVLAGLVGGFMVLKKTA